MDFTQDTRYWKAFIEQKLNDSDRQRILDLLANDVEYADAFRAFEIEYTLAKAQWTQQFNEQEPDAHLSHLNPNPLIKWAAPLGATVVLLTAGAVVWNHCHQHSPVLPQPAVQPAQPISPPDALPHATPSSDTLDAGVAAAPSLPTKSKTPRSGPPKDTLWVYQQQQLASLIREKKLTSNNLGYASKGPVTDKHLQDMYDGERYKELIASTDTLNETDRSLGNFMRALAFYQLGGTKNLRYALSIFQFLEKGSDYALHARWNSLLLMATLGEDKQRVCGLWEKIKENGQYANNPIYGYTEKMEGAKMYLKGKGYTCI